MSKYRNLMMGVCAAIAAMLISLCVQAQTKGETMPYGANPAAGHYLRVDDTNIYYETDGSDGTPLVLLHGGLDGETAIIPSCGHVVLACKGQFTIAAVQAFRDRQER